MEQVKEPNYDLRKDLSEAVDGYFNSIIQDSWRTEEIVNLCVELYSANISEYKLDEILEYYQSLICRKDMMSSRALMP